MIIRAIEIEYWRHLLDKCVIRFDEAVNVLTGPNEAGKSTLFEALLYALTERPDSNKASLASIRPKNRELRPRVAVEVDMCGAAYRIEKTFFEKREHTVLKRKEKGSWVPLSQDRDALTRIATLLKQDGAEDIMCSLWAWQGNAAQILGEGVSGDTKMRLSGMLSGLLITDEDRRLLDWVESEWARLLTPRRRQPTGAWREALEVHREAERELAEANDAVAAHEGLVSQLSETRREVQSLKHKRQESALRCELARNQKRAWDEYRLKRADYEQAAARSSLLTDVRKKWSSAIDALSECELQLEDAQKECVLATEQRDSAKTAHDEASQRTKHAHAQKERAHRLYEFAQLLEWAQDHATLKGLRESLPIAPSAVEMRQIREQNRVFTELEIRLESMRLRMSVTPHVELSGSVQPDASESAVFSANVGETHTWSAAQSIKLCLRGIADLEVATGMQDAKNLEQDLERQILSLGRMLGTWHSEALSENLSAGEMKHVFSLVERRFEEAECIRARCQRLEQKIQDRFPKLVHEEPEIALAEFLSKISDEPYTGVVKQMQSLGRDELLKQTEALEEQISRYQEALEQASLEEDLAKARLDRRESDLNRVQWSVDQLKRKKAEVLKQLLEARSEAVAKEAALTAFSLKQWSTDECFQGEAERNQEAFIKLSAVAEHAAREAARLLEQAELSKPQGAQVDAQHLEEAEKALQFADEQLRQTERVLSNLEGQVKQSADGLHEKVQRADERAASTRIRLASVAQEAMALDLLRAVIIEERDKVVNAVLEPVRQTVSKWLPTITEGRYHDVELDRNGLQPTHLMRDDAVLALGRSADDTREVSYGTREQLALLTRLSLATLMASESRQPLVLDDPLVNTDSTRQLKAWEILLEASERLQMIVLTCHPVPHEIESRLNIREFPSQV